MFGYLDEEIALEEKEMAIRAFLNRHVLRVTDWYSVMERGYLKAAEMVDTDDPLFPKFAYWLMRHELYRKRKESTMEKEKRKINYPSFAWSPKRKKKLSELYQDGFSIPDIAAYFKTDESTIYKGIDKFELVRVIQKPQDATAPLPVAPESPVKVDAPTTAPAETAALIPAEPKSPIKAEAPAPIKETPPTTKVPPAVYIDRYPPDIHSLLKELLHFVVEANNHNNDTLAALDEVKLCPAYFELGQQCAKLSAAEKVIKRLLNMCPEP